LVQEIMPCRRTRSSGTGYCSTSRPSLSSSFAATAAIGAQSPGGLEDGVRTSAARKFSRTARRAAMSARTRSLVSADAGIGSAFEGADAPEPDA
jgi:hypothetical protein